MTAARLAPGDRVGPYRVDRHVATGAMADVYQVRHLERGTLHALKCLTGGSPRLQRRLQREAELQQQLSHPNVVSIAEVLDVAGGVGLVMEYVDGPTLADHLRDRSLSPAEAAPLFGGVAAGVAHAHRRGLVHRDLKPSNVLLARTPEGLLPKVADFGLAKAVAPDTPQERLTASGASIGSPWYMAPEQIRDPSAVDARADVFSLGCILYEMLTGHRAFPGNDPLSVLNAVAAGRHGPLPDDLPRRLAAVITRCLHPDPAQRYADASAVVEALKPRPRTDARSAVPEPERPVRDTLQLLGSAAILAAAMLVGALIAWALIG